MEHKFKVGDKVKCVNADFADPIAHYEGLVLGNEYEVIELRCGELIVKPGGLSWPASRFELIQPANNWIKWSGGECPVAAGTKVEYKCPSAGTFTSEMPEELRWKHIGLAGDIIAYRVVEGAAQGFIPGTTTVDVGEAVQEDSGSAATSKHYNAQAIQPIELMQLSLSPEEFKGFLKGNIMKYSMRAGSKAGESVFKDTVKAKQYKMWLDLVEQGVKIDPRTHVVIKGQ